MGEAAGPLGPLLRTAADVEPLRFVIDADDPVFLPPGDMPGRVAGWLAERGLPVPSGHAEITRCILDSLALAYRRALLSALSLSGRHADVVHIVGGGSRNELLCQLTADATGLPVLAGPAEAEPPSATSLSRPVRSVPRRRHSAGCACCSGTVTSSCAPTSRPAARPPGTRRLGASA